MRNKITELKRIAVKIGTSSLTHKNGKFDFSKIEQLVQVLSELKMQGNEITLVSSGAIAVGSSSLGLEKRPEVKEEKQACAAIGQTGLMSIYENFFNKKAQQIGQILLTKDDLEIESRLTNAKNTLEKLLDIGIIPIVNENDTISTLQIQFGDNDTLSAYVSKIINADLLIILSDIDGLYTADPKSNPNATIIPQINAITKNIENLAKGSGSTFGTGGMQTKIEAAKICQASNISMIIANGENPQIINEILKGKQIGTFFNFYKKKK